MSILRHIESTPEERIAYLRQAAALRRAAAQASGVVEGIEDQVPASNGDDEESTETAIELSQERFAQLAACEEFLLTVTERGFGKRTSSYEYRIVGRGGQGIWNMDMSERNGPVVATFTVLHNQDVMLVTDGGQIIRMPVDSVRIAGRRTQGVTLFRVAEGERVVSVAALDDQSGDEEVGGEDLSDTGAITGEVDGGSA